MSIPLRRLTCLALAALMTAVSGYAQNVKVTGRVTEAGTGEPVPGAAILVKNGKAGTVTDGTGSYSITVPSDAALICSSIGYVDAEQQVGGRAVIDFTLSMDSEMLEETIVVGYGTLKKSQLVGSVEQISGEELADRSYANVGRSLQGQVAGLNIIQLDGKPNHAGEVYIRSNSTSYTMKANMTSNTQQTFSIGQGGSALVLIDGAEGDLSSVNPDDIESVSVLKDASSSSIYGARAAYGVILITTKTAALDKISVTYNGSFSVNQRTVMWEDHIVTDGLEWAETFYDFWTGRTETPTAAGALPTKINTYDIPSNYLDMFRQRRAEGNTNVYDMYNGKYLYFGSENWFARFYKKLHTSNSHSISISGSSKRISYSLTGRYYSQEGIYKVGDQSYNQFNIRSKVSLKVFDWLSFDNNTYLFRMDFKDPIFSKSDEKVGSQIQGIGMLGFAIMPAVNEDGSWTYGAAGTGYESFSRNNSAEVTKDLSVTTTTGITIEPFKDVFMIRGDISYKFADKGVERYASPCWYSSTPGTILWYTDEATSYKKQYRYETNHLSANVVATYTPNLGEAHKLNAVAGWNLENHSYDIETTLRHGLMYPGMTSFELFSGSEITLQQFDRNWSTVGAFARVNYTLLNRYILEGSIRFDANSRFPENERWGVFPSASAGWRVAEEPWMKWSRSVLDNMKIRGNWGALGNGGVAPYSFLETMSIAKTSLVVDGGYVNYVGMPSIVPETLTWERIKTWCIGLDMDLFKNRLSFSGDYYVRFADNLYSRGPDLPDLLGASTPMGNFGQLTTKGWELTLSWRDSFKLGGKPFSYSVKGSLWDSRTRVTEFQDDTNDIYGYYEGKEIGEIWGFKTDGLFMTNEEAAAWYPDKYHNLLTPGAPYAGDIKFLDTNGDKEISVGAGKVNDHGDLERIGNIMPRYQFGVNMDFRWNGIGLSVFLQGVGHRDWYPSLGTALFWGGYGRAYDHSLKDQRDVVILDKSSENWKVTNPGAYWPRRLYAAANAGSGYGTMNSYNDYFLLNAAYLRLKNLTLDYTIPSKWLEKMHIEKLRIYLSGDNLLTWSPIYEHTSMFDPEVIGKGDTDYSDGGNSTSDTMGDGYSYPMLRSFTLGINLTF